MRGESRSFRVSIFGMEYDIRGESDEEYVRQLAECVDSVMNEIYDRTRIVSMERIAILAALNIADRMNKERQKLNELIEKLELELEKALNIRSENSKANADSETQHEDRR